MRQILPITRKELGIYFSSPMALIFVGAFLAVTLFSFFWVDTFFARGIADVRPLFKWMPLLLIFLVAALTMRQWSEEQRAGTLEVLLTLPIAHIQLILGKFLAVLGLVAVALALTLILPISVSILGNLDWGPVIGGYLAAFLLASCYAAIGLFVSSRTDNQIVALISTVLICGAFYLIGSQTIAGFLPDRIAGILQAMGTGSRFESIQRGVIDLRDLLYYLSLTLIFLTLNSTSLDMKRWSTGEHTLAQRREATLGTSLIVLNLIIVNVWITPLRSLRLDLTQQKLYSLSATTRDLLSNLQEPLLIRGYFSERTHPLLAPLVPQIEDMLNEYQIAAQGKIDLEFLDPVQDPEKEAEANQVYGIRPSPFQVTDRYEASVINSYFDILIRYGDQSMVLDYGDLIEVEQQRDGGLDVRLQNLEYDLTRSIKKVVYGFQSIDAVLASLSEPVHLTLFATPDTIPESLQDVATTIGKVADEIQSKSQGKFIYEVIDPDQPGAAVTSQDLYDLYGLRPIAASLFSEEGYFLDMVLQVGDQDQLLYPSGDLGEADIRSTIEAALKRASTGFLKVVGLWTPPAVPTQDIYGQTQEPLSSWDMVAEQLRQEYEVRSIDLSSGQVPFDIDVLVLIAPQGFTDVERYAIDQYLMRGGAVIAAAGNYGIQIDPLTGGLGVSLLEDGIGEMLASYGLTVENALVMDTQNEPFPVPVYRQVGNVTVQEIQLINYPFFVDVRSDGMDSQNPIVTDLNAVTMNWASPVRADEEKNADRDVVQLLQSTTDSWSKLTTNIQPDFDMYPDLGFAQGESDGPYPLAFAVQGRFDSYFQGQPSPLDTEGTAEDPASSDQTQSTVGTIDVSPDTARLVVIGSAEFVDDVVLNLSSRDSSERYLNSLRFLQNAVDWGVEDLDLLSIRSRGTQTHILEPMEVGEQRLWEEINYGAALLGLIAIGMVWNIRRRNEEPIHLVQGESAGLRMMDQESKSEGEK
jgi:ABC-2 type transport system permease protein